MQDKHKTITITLTQSCNLNCVYCYEQHKSKEAMSLSIAKKIVDKEFALDDGFDEIEFDLFGGEPFLNFGLIKEITDYIIHYPTDKKVIIFIVTNGTLVHGEIQEWLKENRKYVMCGLSLDGNKKMNDINRSNSFDDIDIDFFLELYPEQGVKMTVSPQTLPFMAEGVIFLHRKGFPVSCNLAYNIDWSDGNNAKILERELLKLIDYYLENPDIEPASILSLDISNVALDKGVLRPFCGAGRGMKAYDVDGECYPCQFFMPLSVGEEKARQSKNLKFYQDYIPESVWDEKCKDCVIKQSCPTCFGANYCSSGNMYYHDDNFCKLTKITAKARSYFKAMQLGKGQLNGMSDEKKAILVKSILKIQNELII